MLWGTCLQVFVWICFLHIVCYHTQVELPIEIGVTPESEDSFDDVEPVPGVNPAAPDSTHEWSAAV